MAAESAMSRRLREYAGVALFAVALLWLIALVTYSENDPAPFFNSLASGPPQNFAGPVGAFMAEAAFQLLGYAAFLIPVLFGYLAWHYFWCVAIDAGFTKAVGVALLFASVTALLSLIFSAFDTGARHFPAGGLLGAGVAMVFSAFLNRTGAAILLLTLLGFSLIWLNPEPPHLWQGDSDMPKYAQLCNNVLKVSNLRELNDAVDSLLST